MIPVEIKFTWRVQCSQGVHSTVISTLFTFNPAGHAGHHFDNELPWSSCFTNFPQPCSHIVLYHPPRRDVIHVELDGCHCRTILHDELLLRYVILPLWNIAIMYISTIIPIQFQDRKKIHPFFNLLISRRAINLSTGIHFDMITLLFKCLAFWNNMLVNQLNPVLVMTSPQFIKLFDIIISKTHIPTLVQIANHRLIHLSLVYYCTTNLGGLDLPSGWTLLCSNSSGTPTSFPIPAENCSILF